MLFFLYGEDDYRSKEKLNEIKKKFIKDVDESGYNIVLLDENITVEKFSKEFSQTGFLARKKLIIIKNLLKQNITRDLEDIVLNCLNKFKNHKEQVRYNKDQAESDKNDNIIVFYESWLPHSKKEPLSGVRLKIFKKLDSFKYSQEFKKLDNYKTIQWIQKEFEKNGKTIDKKSADLILASAGNNLWVLKNEIDKISNYTKNKEINEKDIKGLISMILNDDIFLFSDYLAQNNKKMALKLLDDQIDSGVNSIYLLTMIIRQFRILFRIKSAMGEGVTENRLASYLSLHPFVIKKSIASVKLYSLNDLKKIYRKLLKLDQKIKSSKLKSKTLIDLFILSF